MNSSNGENEKQHATTNGIEGEVSGTAVQARDVRSQVIFHGTVSIGHQHVGDVHHYHQGAQANGTPRP